MRLVADPNALRRFYAEAFFCLRIICFFLVLLDCNLFEINISYSFGNIKFTMPTACGEVDRPNSLFAKINIRAIQSMPLLIA